MTVVRKQESSYFIDWQRKDGIVLDANWSGKWEIQDSNDTMQVSGAASLSGDNYSLEFRIKSTDTALLLGKYTVIYEVTNETLGFQREFTESIMFLAQNIT